MGWSSLTSHCADSRMPAWHCPSNSGSGAVSTDVRMSATWQKAPPSVVPYHPPLGAPPLRYALRLRARSCRAGTPSPILNMYERFVEIFRKY
eukprot:2213042-Pyramimonas_sp.AAC.2